MTHKVTLNPRQQISLEGLASQQGGKAGELRVWFSILEKVETKKDFRDLYLKTFPNGISQWDEGELALAGTVEVELDTNELQKILDLLNNYDRFLTPDMRWVTPTVKTITDLLDSEVTTSRASKTRPIQGRS